MVAHAPPAATRHAGSDSSSEASPEAPRWRRQSARLIVFVGTVGAVLTYALPGGAYDLVTRQAYGLMVWWILGIGFACGLLPRTRPHRLMLGVLGVLAAYACWTALSLSWTESAERTVAELARTLDYIGVITLIISVLDRSTWRAAAFGLVFAALLVCMLAVASRLAPAAFPADTVGRAFSTDRLNYPFGYWNALGAWAAMSTAMGLAWSVHDRSRARRALVLALVPIAGVATYLAYSRAAIAGAALGVVAVMALSRKRLKALLYVAVAALGTTFAILAARGAPEIARRTGSHGAGPVLGSLALAAALAVAVAILKGPVRTRHRRLPRSVLRPLVAACALAVVLAGAAFGPRLVSRAWADFRHPIVANGSDPAARLTSLSGTRYETWSTALEAFTSHPLTGIGAGTFEFWWNRHQRNLEFVRNAHSLEIENMAELGAPGFLLILALLVASIAVLASARRACRRSASFGACTALMVGFTVYLLASSVDWMWQSTAVTVLSLSGIAVGATRLADKRPKLRWYGRAAVLLLSIGAAYLQVPGLLSTAAVRRSQAAARGGDASLALAWANEAVRAEAWAASPYEQRGLVLESAGRLAGAAADLQRAARRERTNFRHWLLLARVETEQGLFAIAIRDYRRARRLRPKGLVFEFAPVFRGLPTRSRSPRAG